MESARFGGPRGNVAQLAYMIMLGLVGLSPQWACSASELPVRQDSFLDTALETLSGSTEAPPKVVATQAARRSNPELEQAVKLFRQQKFEPCWRRKYSPNPGEC